MSRLKNVFEFGLRMNRLCACLKEATHGTARVSSIDGTPTPGDNYGMFSEGGLFARRNPLEEKSQVNNEVVDDIKRKSSREVSVTLLGN